METSRSFKIPSPESRFYRKSFYGLHRRFAEPIEKWFERIETDMNSCGFDELAEYLLLDKFFSELSDEEVAALQSERQTWSLKQLQRFLRTENGHETESGGTGGAHEASYRSSTMQPNEVVIETMPVKMEFAYSEASDIGTRADGEDYESQSNFVNDDNGESSDDNLWVDKRFACAECDERFASIPRLEHHINGGKCVKYKPPRSKKQYICDICNKECKTKDTLKRHRWTHGEKQFACDICGLKLAAKNCVKRHKRTQHPESVLE